MARVLTRVSDPLGLASQSEGPDLPLLLGSYVHVDIEGQEMIDVVEVPRSAVHAGRYVYLFGSDGTLSIRDVKIAWRKPESLLISEGLKDGDEVITSRLSNAVEGLKLRRVEQQANEASTKKAALNPAGSKGGDEQQAKVAGESADRVAP
jgi:hypothetical protein